ncbi:MAG: response regulator [Ignavibacteriae bacterium]|nr:response regulator [Ignavibacteriota bacterium]
MKKNKKKKLKKKEKKKEKRKEKKRLNGNELKSEIIVKWDDFDFRKYNELSNDILSENNYDKVIKKILNLLGDSNIADKIYYFHLDSTGNDFRLEYGSDKEKKEIINYRSLLLDNNTFIKNSLLYDLSKTEKSYFDKYPFKKDILKNDNYISSESIKWVIFYPIVFQKNIIGALFIEGRNEKPNIDKYFELIKLIGSSFGIAIYKSLTIKSLKKTLEQERISRQAEENYFELKNELLSNISLELNTRLNGIIGITESLIKGNIGQLPGDVEYNLSLISSAGKQLSFIANDILDFSKLDTSEIVVRKKPGDLGKVSHYVASLSKILIGDKNIKFRNTIDKNSPFVFGDENKIQFVLYDLVSNAVKYTETGEIIASARTRDGMVIISVSDTGIGISPEKLDTLFKNISDIKEAAKKEGFTGFSLAIDKYLVELHKGKIWAESALNKGSVFSFSIPVYDEELYNKKYQDLKPFETPLDTSSESEEIDTKIIQQGIKILVVDDEPIMAQLIKNYFSLYNYNIIVCHDGLTALQSIMHNPDFDLIVLDVMMPKMSGLDVARQIRQNYSLFELPILILTARNQIADLVEGFEAGANDYLLKPFDGNELIARGKTLIKLRRLTKVNLILQEAIELKNQFINMTVHDLKNPLNVIQGISVMLKDLGITDATESEMIDLIYESSTLMSNLINELLENASLESGKLTIDKKIIDLNEVVEDIVESNKSRAENKQQTLIFNPGMKDGCFISGDNIRIYEIIDNLISNAIKYSPKNKNINVNISLIKIKRNKFIRCEVKDEGPGLSNEDMKKLFGKFQRLSAQPTGGESSTGLGLSIVKQLVELHDGTIWAESELGKGSSFFVQFPAADKKNK